MEPSPNQNEINKANLGPEAVSKTQESAGFFREKSSSIPQEKRVNRRQAATNQEIIADKIKKNVALTYSQRSYFVPSLKKYFEEKDLSEYQNMRKRALLLRGSMAFLSAGNAAIVGFLMKKYTNLKRGPMLGTSLAMYMFSYYFATKGIDKEEDQLNSHLIDKYFNQYQESDSKQA